MQRAFQVAFQVGNPKIQSGTAARDPETGDECPLFNPRTQVWREHFRWSEDGLRVVGLTPVGRATVPVLRLDSHEQSITVRRNWVAVCWHPPTD